jgi:predicted amidohydrolase
MTVASWRATCIQMPSEIATKAATAQAAWAVIERNIATAVRLIEQACDGPNPPRLVVLPEFALQGPPHGETIVSWLDKACTPIPGPATAALQEVAARRGIFIGGNLFESDTRWPGRFFNSCFLIDSKGEVILRYRRINTALWPSPHDFMDDYLAEYGPEGTFPVVDTELGRLAMVACGEISVPEVIRQFMSRGAEVLIHPTNEELSAGQEAAKIARAAENMMYVVSANVAGGIGFSADASVLGGRSRIIDFRGNTMAFEADAHESTAVSTMIDVEALRSARRDLGLGNALLRNRWEMYRAQYSTASFYPPNSFLQAPMKDAAETRAPSEKSLERLYELGIAVR